MKYELLPQHRVLFIWVKIIASMLTIWLLGVFPRRDLADNFAVIHFIGFFLVLKYVENFVYTSSKSRYRELMLYVKENYPQVWGEDKPYTFDKDPKKVAKLFRGEYDDGTDDMLNEMKFHIKNSERLVIWSFLVSGFAMLVGFFSHTI